MHDQTFSFLKNPYGFIAEEARKRSSECFETRLLLQKTICMTGAEAAAKFYDPRLFIRKGAAPGPVKATLFGRGGVQGLDGVAHRRRKEMLMSLLTPDQVQSLGILVRETFRLEAVRWSLRGEISFYEESQKVITEAVCKWAGIPMENENISERTRDLASLFDKAGAKGLGHLKARAHRAKAEAWIASLIREIRKGKMIAEQGSVLGTVAAFKDHRFQLLDERTAAVEVLNILRPTIAVSVYMVFIAHALSLFPDQRPDLASKTSVRNFLQEVRRYYPFFPAVTARVRKTFTWKEIKFAKGERVMLDIFGTNHDSRYWKRPEEFNPSRFADGTVNLMSFIPQGGGDAQLGHRCPGEELALELMKQSLHFLCEDVEYTVPSQDLMLDFTRLPALPASHFRMSVVNLNYIRSSRPSPSSYYNDNSYHFSHQ